MACEQERRENKTSEREIKVEKDLVPKMTSHFEALIVKDEKLERNLNLVKKKVNGDDEGEGHSLQKIAKYRQEAQQNSMEAIREAQERYAAKAKELGTTTLQTLKESTSPVVGYPAEKDERSFEESNMSEGRSSMVKKVSEFAIDEEEHGVEDTGVLGAIKETIAEIGVAATQFLLGQPLYYAYGGASKQGFEQEVGKKQH